MMIFALTMLPVAMLLVLALIVVGVLHIRGERLAPIKEAGNGEMSRTLSDLLRRMTVVENALDRSPSIYGKRRTRYRSSSVAPHRSGRMNKPG